MISEVFFPRNLAMQFVLSHSIVEVTVDGVKSAVHFSAIFGFLECLGFGHYDFTWILYHRSYADSVYRSTRYHVPAYVVLWTIRTIP